MAETSLFEQLSVIATDALRSALDGTNPNLPALMPPDAAAARADLDALLARAREVTDAADPAAWASALEGWAGAWQDLARDAFGGSDPGSSMLVRVLQERTPRIAAFLALTGVIVTPVQGPASIDWPRLQELLTDPGTVVNEDLWDAILGDAGLPGTGYLPAVIVALLILFPQTLLALVHGGLQIAPLAPPATDGPGPWRDFRTASANWISFTLPLPDPAKPAGQQVPRTIYDLVADLDPQLSATIALRSDRRILMGRSVTDFEMWLVLALQQDKWEHDFGDHWVLRVTPGLSAGFGHSDDGWHGAFRAFATQPLPATLGPDDPVAVTFSREDPAGAPDVALGPPYDTRLIINDLGAYLKLRENHPIVEVGIYVHQLSAVLTNRWWRTFGATNTTFGEGIRFDLDLDVAYVEGKGLLLNLQSGLQVTFDLDWTPLGDRPPAVNSGQSKPADKPFDLTIHSITLGAPIQATQDDFNIRAEIRIHASLRIGPVTGVIDGVGGWVGWWTEGMPPQRDHIGFLPPTGVGLQLQLTGVAGGGFLDFTGGPDDKFAGLLYLRIQAFEVTAFGIHQLTGQPSDAQRRTSFVMVIGIRFSPGIQLGYGFAITGFGGLVGINRRSDTDALRERLTSGAAGNVLFAEDPVRNAPDILDDLDALFPAADGVYVFGPTIQISWLSVGTGKLVRFDVGLFIEFPGPSKIVLLGSVRASLPGDTDNKIFFIRIDLVGVLDFNKKVLEFDATLISSHVFEVFVVTGDAAFRASWGDKPYMMLSIGGFYPGFNPEPAVFPELTRVALTQKKSFASLFLRGEAYFAATTNTLQFGARIEAGVHLGPLNAVGFVSLDALLQFVPFHFEVDFAAGFQVRWNELSLGEVTISGTIAGPGPVTLSAKFSVGLLFWSIDWSDSWTLGSAPVPAPPPVGSVVQKMQAELGEPSNLSADGGSDPHAAQQLRGSPAGVVVSPLGNLVWTQNRAPLGIVLDRFEGQPLDGQQQLVIAADTGDAAAVQDWFSPGSYAALGTAEALSRPSFERLQAGLGFGFGEDASDAVDHPYTVTEIRLPEPPRTVGPLPFPVLILDGVLARTGAAGVRTTAAAVSVGEEPFVVRGADGSVLRSASSQTDAYAEAKRTGGQALPLADVVELAGV
jgi:uncharacterized protein DUF6603